jgi:hypothetical protein
MQKIHILPVQYSYPHDIYKIWDLKPMGMNCHKVVNASPAHIHQYKNLKRKLYSCNANIYFNQGFVQRIWLHLADLIRKVPVIWMLHFT